MDFNGIEQGNRNGSDVQGLQPPKAPMPEAQKRSKSKKFDTPQALFSHHFSTIERRDRSGYNRRWKKWHTNWNFYDGRQEGFFDEDGDGSYYDVEPDEQNKFYTCNFLSWQVDTTQKEWARAKTLLLAKAVGDKEEKQGGARSAKDIMGHYQRKSLTPIAQQTEGLTAAACSVYFRYTNINPTTSGGKGKLPIMETKTEKLGEDSYECLDCLAKIDEYLGDEEAAPEQQSFYDSQFDSKASSMGGMSDLDASMPDGSEIDPSMPIRCPSCGSENIQVSQAPTVEYDEMVDEEEVDLPDIETWWRDPFGIRVHPRARCGQIKTSPYLFCERKVDLWEAEETYWWVDWEQWADKTAKEGDKSGLRFSTDLERSPGSTTHDPNSGAMHSNYDDENCEEDVWIKECWFDRNMYAGYIFDEEWSIGNPDDPFVIQAGIPVEEQHPNGIMLVKLGDKYVDGRPENKNDHWDCGIFRVFPPSFWGRGAMDDSVWQQKLLNDVYNMMVDYLRYCTAPTILLNPDFVDSQQASGNFGEMISVNNANPDANLSAYYQQINPPPMPASIPNFIEMCKHDIQAQLGAFAPLAGSPTGDLDITTATGIKLLREASIALIAMALSIKALVDAQWGHKVLKLAQKYFWIPRSIMSERQHGKLELDWFSSADIEGDYEITFAQHSVTPRSESEDQNDFIAAMNVGNMELGLWNPMLRQVAPEAVKLGRERFNIPFDADELSQTERVAKERLDRLTDLAGQLPMIAEEMMMPMESMDPLDPNAPSPAVQYALAQVPIELDFDDHPAHMQYLTNFAHEDAWLEADETLRQIIRARFNEHFNAEVVKNQKKSAAMVASQAPEMMAAQQQEPQGGPGKAGKPKPNSRKAPAGSRSQPQEEERPQAAF